MNKSLEEKFDDAVREELSNYPEMDLLGAKDFIKSFIDENFIAKEEITEDSLRGDPSKWKRYTQEEIDRDYVKKEEYKCSACNKTPCNDSTTGCEGNITNFYEKHRKTSDLNGQILYTKAQVEEIIGEDMVERTTGIGGSFNHSHMDGYNQRGKEAKDRLHE